MFSCKNLEIFNTCVYYFTIIILIYKSKFDKI